MDLNSGWTGRAACALQAAFRLSNESFAEHLGIGVRTVATWHQKPTLRPKSEMQQLLDTALERATPAVQERFTALVEGPATTATTSTGAAETDEVTTEAERRLTADPNISGALDWLDQHAGWGPGTARQEVASALTRLDVRALRDKRSRRERVDQQTIAAALGDYYGPQFGDHGRYCVRYGTDEPVTTSVLTSPAWLDIDCPLIATHDRLKVRRTTADPGVTLDDESAGWAVQRLAETLALNVRLVDMPLYQLLEIDVHEEKIGGSVGVARFVEYALTMDLLEGELVDALANEVPLHEGTLPVRHKYLPNVESVVGVEDRLCSGGTLALCAIARPASPFRGPADYLLLVQERSGSVVNAVSRLAVIPKGFHQPLTDFRADAQIGATLRREMEEELFGREDIDNTVSDQRKADPMHPSRMSEPMRWLMEEPERLRMECTGLGLNLVSGNFEFAGLIVVEDEEFWNRYGGVIEANWESSNLRQYSSVDGDLLAELVQDVAWTNEGLFALFQGLRRLHKIGGERVNLPDIEWELR